MSEPISSESHDSMDDVINVYKKDVDRTLLRANLKLTVEERLRKAEAHHNSVTKWLGAGKRTVQRTDFSPVTSTLDQVIARLNDYRVKYVVVGGWAVIIHGVARANSDLDLVYSRTKDNIKRLVDALEIRSPICAVRRPVSCFDGTFKRSKLD